MVNIIMIYYHWLIMIAVSVSKKSIVMTTGVKIGEMYRRKPK